jgi:hypothetical protein
MENYLPSSVIGESIFNHPNCQKYRRTYHRTHDGHQLDHICISRKWRRSLLDVKNKRSADIQSDHELLLAEIRLKFARVQQKSDKVSKKFDINKLKDRAVKQSFVDHLKQLD